MNTRLSTAVIVLPVRLCYNARDARVCPTGLTALSVQYESTPDLSLAYECFTVTHPFTGCPCMTTSGGASVSQISQELSGFRPMDVQLVPHGPSQGPARMRGSGVLLRIATSRRGRRELARRIGSSEQEVLDWVKRADLSRVNGVDMVYSGLLAAAGVATVPDLARRNPGQLYDRLVDVNRASGLVRKLPGKRQVSSWVSQAKSLPRVISY